MGNLQQALVCFEKRLVVAHELGEASDKAQAYGELGTLHRQLGNCEQAISCLERQLAIARDMKDQALEGSAACGLGSVYQQMGEYETALQYHQLDLQIAEETNNPACQGRAYGNLGLTYESLGTYERAVVYQEQHLSIAAQMNDLVAKTASYSSLGRTHHALQNYSQAVMYLQEGECLAPLSPGCKSWKVTPNMPLGRFPGAPACPSVNQSRCMLWLETAGELGLWEGFHVFPWTRDIMQRQSIASELQFLKEERGCSELSGATGIASWVVHPPLLS